MHVRHLLLFGLLFIVVCGCGQGQSAPSAKERITDYQGTPLPTPDDPVWRRAYPPAWLVVGDQITAGMYVGGGGGERIPDLSQLPRVKLPTGIEPVVVIGTEAIAELGAATQDLTNGDVPAQPLGATRKRNEPSTYTLAPITATSPQFLQVGAQLRNSEGVLDSVSYGWEITPQESE